MTTIPLSQMRIDGFIYIGSFGPRVVLGNNSYLAKYVTLFVIKVSPIVLKI